MSAGRRDGNPLGFFEELYAVVVGLGLALALEQVIDLESSGVPIAGEHVPLFLAFLNIAFALAHASVRYLQLAYIERAIGEFRRGRVIADLVLGVGHFLWLMALSFLITRPTAFAYAAIVLLVGRPIRDGILMLGKRPVLEFDKKIASVHLVTIAALALVLVLTAFTDGSWVLRGGVLAASLTFGLGTYLFAFSYFFPGVDTDRPEVKS